MTDYLYLSQVSIWFNRGNNSRARKVQQNQATAHLLEAVDQYRLFLQGLDYDEFCSELSRLSGYPQPYTIDNKSADWTGPFQYANSKPEQFKFLVDLTQSTGDVLLPITDERFNALELSLQDRIRFINDLSSILN